MTRLLWLFFSLWAQDPEEDARAEAVRVQAELELARCQLAVREDRREQAVALCTRAQELDPGLGRAFVWRAQALWRLGRHDDAIADLETATGLDPGDAASLRQLGAWQFERGNMVWAARNLHRALGLLPGDARLRLLCALAFMENRELAGALELVTPALTHAEEGIRQQAHLIAGACHLELGQRDRARAHLRKVDRGEPARQARELLARLTRAERGFPPGFAMRVSWALGFDSNPAFDQDLGVPRPSTLASTLEQVLRLSWSPTTALQLQGGIQYHYFIAPWDGDRHERVIAFSSLGADVQAAGRVFLSGLRYPSHLELAAGYQALALMGGEGMPGEPEPFVFTERVTGSAFLAMQVGPAQEWEGGLTAWHAAFRDSDRDGPGLMWTARGSWFFLGKRAKLFAQSFVSYQDARWSAWRQWAAGQWMGFSTRLPDRFELAATVSLEGRYFPDSGEAMEAAGNPWNLARGEDRLDLLGSAGLVLSRPLGQDALWRWEVVLRGQWMESAVDYFSFSRWICLVQLAGDISRK